MLCITFRELNVYTLYLKLHTLDLSFMYPETYFFQRLIFLIDGADNSPAYSICSLHKQIMQLLQGLCRLNFLYTLFQCFTAVPLHLRLEKP